MENRKWFAYFNNGILRNTMKYLPMGIQLATSPCWLWQRNLFTSHSEHHECYSHDRTNFQLGGFYILGRRYALSIYYSAMRPFDQTQEVYIATRKVPYCYSHSLYSGRQNYTRYRNAGQNPQLSG